MAVCSCFVLAFFKAPLYTPCILFFIKYCGMDFFFLLKNYVSLILFPPITYELVEKADSDGTLDAGGTYRSHMGKVVSCYFHYLEISKI